VDLSRLLVEVTELASEPSESSDSPPEDSIYARKKADVLLSSQAYRLYDGFETIFSEERNVHVP
jgi:hypothetical protein